MDVDDFAFFVRVVERGSIGAAGRDFGLSPAAASTRLATFERKLGTRLLHRTTRQLTLTEEGLAFLPHAHLVVEAAEAASAVLVGGARRPSGTLRIAAPASFGRQHLVPALPAFLSRYPELSIDMRLSDDMIDLVGDGIDVAVRDAELGDSSLVARKLAPDKRLLVAAPSYLEHRPLPASLRDLLDHDCLVVGSHDLWSFNTGREIETVRVRARLRVSDGEAVRDAAVAGLGISLQSTWNVWRQLRDGALVPVLAEIPIQSAHAIWAIYPSARQLAPKVRAVIDFLAERFGGTAPYWDALPLFPELPE